MEEGFVSGELLLRSDEANCRSLPAKFEARLRSSLSGRLARRRAASTLERIGVLRRASGARVGASRVACACAVARGEFLSVHAARGERLAAREAARAERARRRALDASLAALAVRYGAVLAAERRASGARERAAEGERRRALATLAARARLASFGLHVDHETRGGVALRRLGPADAQWARCRRAAGENARRGFFAPGWRFGGLDVVDVYKVENRALLDDFQARTDALGRSRAAAGADAPADAAGHHHHPEAAPAGDGAGAGAAAAAKAPKQQQQHPDKAAAHKQVKGLFCAVPSECVERLCVYGLRDDAARVALERHFFDDAWIASTSAATPQAPARGRAASPGAFGRASPAAARAAAKPGGGRDDLDDDDLDDADGAAHFGASRAAARDAPRVPFPCPFSRYSTLEELRPAATAGTEADGDALRFLALCRVLVGDVRVVDAHQPGPAAGADADAFDSLYSPVARGVPSRRVPSRPVARPGGGRASDGRGARLRPWDRPRRRSTRSTGRSSPTTSSPSSSSSTASRPTRSGARPRPATPPRLGEATPTTSPPPPPPSRASRAAPTGSSSPPRPPTPPRGRRRRRPRRTRGTTPAPSRTARTTPGPSPSPPPSSPTTTTDAAPRPSAPPRSAPPPGPRSPRPPTSTSPTTATTPRPTTSSWPSGSTSSTTRSTRSARSSPTSSASSPAASKFKLFRTTHCLLVRAPVDGLDMSRPGYAKRRFNASALHFNITAARPMELFS